MFRPPLIINILLRVEPLLCNNRERSKYTRVVSKQRFGKQVAAATNRRATIEVLLKMMFSTRSVPRGYKEENWGNQVNSVRESEATRVQLVGSHRSERPEAEIHPLLEAVTRKCLVKTSQAGKQSDLQSVEICYNITVISS
jgi:hypothetical protein